MPERAIVLIDVQNSQLGRNLGPNTVDQVVENTNRLIEAGRRTGALIVYVVSSNLSSGGDALAVMADDRPKHQTERAPGWDELIPQVHAPSAETDPVVTKRGWDAFYGSDLDLQLRRHGVEEIIMSGISTNFGVEGTARAAIDRGYRVTFAEDAMTSWTGELHDFAVMNILPRIGRVRSTEQVVEDLGSRVVVS